EGTTVCTADALDVPARSMIQIASTRARAQPVDRSIMDIACLLVPRAMPVVRPTDRGQPEQVGVVAIDGSTNVDSHHLVVLECFVSAPIVHGERVGAGGDPPGDIPK